MWRGIYKTTPTAMVDSQQREPRLSQFGALITSNERPDGTMTAAGTATDPTTTQVTPTGVASNAITPVKAVNVTELLVKAAPGNFYSASIASGATAGYLIAYNAIAIPAAGSALTAALTMSVVPVAANSTAAIGDLNIPDRFSIGVVLLFSTSHVTYTQPANVALFIRGRAV